MTKGDSVWCWTGSEWQSGILLDNSPLIVSAHIQFETETRQVQVINIQTVYPGTIEPCHRCGKVAGVYTFNLSVLCEQCYGEHTN